MAGASSIQNGITISFANMKSVTLSEDKSIASIEPGNLWGTVYETLAEYNLSVVGGRLFDIGVGGLTTGGTTFPLSSLRHPMTPFLSSFLLTLQQVASPTSLIFTGGPATTWKATM